MQKDHFVMIRKSHLIGKMQEIEIDETLIFNESDTFFLLLFNCFGEMHTKDERMNWRYFNAKRA